MNSVVLMGRLTRDPELRRTQSGVAVASFTLAVDRGYASDSGERQTDFIDCVAWRGTGEFISKYFAKGQMCAVTGKLQVRNWTDKDGNKRRSTEVIADSAYFCESKRNAAHEDPAHEGTVPQYTNEFAELLDDDGELPL